MQNIMLLRILKTIKLMLCYCIKVSRIKFAYNCTKTFPHASAQTEDINLTSGVLRKLKLL